MWFLGRVLRVNTRPSRKRATRYVSVVTQKTEYGESELSVPRKPSVYCSRSTCGSAAVARHCRQPQKLFSNSKKFEDCKRTPLFVALITPSSCLKGPGCA